MQDRSRSDIDTTAPCARRALMLVACIAVVAASACADDEPSPPAARSSPARSPSPASAPDPGRRVRFRAADGVRLEGRLFGRGRTGVVLSHMGRAGDDQSGWFEVAHELAGEGYMVLTYNLRGFCPGGANGCSGGTDDLAKTWRDVLGASRFLHERGARRVALVGASIGGMASIYAATRAEPAAVVSIGGAVSASGYRFDRRLMRSITTPKLFASSRGDAYGGAADARVFYRMSDAPKEIALVGGAEHGTDVFLEDSEPARDLLAEIEGFLRRWAPPER